jgi:hypothetical protein
MSIQIRACSALAIVLTLACSKSSNDSQPSNQNVDTTGNSTLPTEWVGFHTEIPLADPTTFHALASGLVGSDAQSGKAISHQELDKGIYIDTDPDKSTPDQIDLTVSFDDGGAFPRKLAVAPASFGVGSVFVAASDAAIAKMQADNAAKPGSGETFYIEYRVYSSQGGRLSFGVKGDFGKYTIVLDISTPKTSLDQKNIGLPVAKTAPYDTVAGTVWFHLSKDDFDYFVDHAYGKGATGRQNFTDFALVPHDWLRLTVDPHLQDEYVNVNFEILGVDGKRTPVAKAPASILAGKTFQTMVDRAMENTINAEKAKPGSSSPWLVPFYYDAPVDGGVVQVLAEGKAGVFDIAYAIESPRHILKDVDPLAYEPVDIPPDDPLSHATCDKLGGTLADKGTLDITFSVSDVVKNSPDLKNPLKGKIACDVYEAQDVTVGGPHDGAVPVQSFTVDGDFTGSAPAPTFSTQVLHSGTYQVLCAMYIDGGTAPTAGDPVTLPIGGFPVACDKNPVTVEFAILCPNPCG